MLPVLDDEADVKDRKEREEGAEDGSGYGDHVEAAATLPVSVTLALFFGEARLERVVHGGLVG